MQAQEAAHLADLEARRTAEALKLQEELLAIESDRRAVEVEKKRIEEEKRRALADIETRTQLALTSLEVSGRTWALVRCDGVHSHPCAALPPCRRSARRLPKRRWRGRPS